MDSRPEKTRSKDTTPVPGHPDGDGWLILNALPFVALIVGPDHRVLGANRAGIELGATPGKSCFEAWQHRSEPCPWCRLDEVFRNGTVATADFEAFGRWWEGHWVPLDDQRTLHYALDVTAHKASEKSALEAREKLQRIIDTIPSCIFVKDTENRFLLVNRALARALGGEPADVVGRTLEELCPIDMALGSYEDDKHVIRSGEPRLGIIEEGTDREGKEQWFSTDKVPITDASGRVTAIVGVATNITAVRRMETALRESEERHRLALEYAADGFALSREGRILFCNRAFLDLFGYATDDEVIGQPIEHFVHPDDRDRVLEHHHKRTAGREAPGRYGFRGVRKNGTTVQVEVAARRARFRDEPVNVAFLRDITKRTHLEEQAQKAQSLESLGTLAGGIAHDFNNLLMSVFGNIELAQLGLDPDSRAYRLLADARTATERSRNLARQLLTFSRGGDPLRERLALAPWLRETTEFALSGSVLRPAFRMDGDLWDVEADRYQIGQVVYNIARNALEAMPAGGVLELRARNIVVGRDGRVPDLKAGRYVEVAFRDEGPGMDEATRQRVFDPYFTTKAMGSEKGRGLGLSICYSIVKKHGGRIEIASARHRGTTVVFFLPAVMEKEAAGRSDTVASDHTVARARILVLEDEEPVALVVREMLQVLGYEVTLENTGDAAVTRYGDAARRGAPFDVVLFDLTIRGGMGGLEAFRRIRQAYPDVCGIVASGYANDEVLAHYERHGFHGKITKPFSLTRLKHGLESVLEGSRGVVGEARPDSGG